jgi:hypothetical protein
MTRISADLMEGESAIDPTMEVGRQLLDRLLKEKGLA